MLAPGSLVIGDTVIKSGQLWAGSPARFVKELSQDEKDLIIKNAKEYVDLASFHIEETSKEFEQLEKDIQENDYRDDILRKYTYYDRLKMTPEEKREI